MFSFLQRLFAKKEAQATAPATVPKSPEKPAATIRTVEVARLSVRAIIARFSDDLKALVQSAPGEGATVDLPFPTIIKQLPSGSVKMSLASFHRQAPPGVLGPLPAGDRRMIEVPLGEVFRHVNLSVLERRVDQRPYIYGDQSFDLFGNSEKPNAKLLLAPPAVDPPKETPLNESDATVDERPEQTLEPAEAASPLAARTLAAPPGMFTQQPKPVPPPPPTSERGGESSGEQPPSPGQPPLLLPLAQLSATWPQDVRDEIANLNGAGVVQLPTSEITAGLAKGKVAFRWGQIRSWIRPSPEGLSSADESLLLTLPLKVVAPAFLALGVTKPGSDRRKPGVEANLPALFTQTRLAATKPASEPFLEPVTNGVALVSNRTPTTVGDVFGQPEKSDWSPAEMVTHLLRLPGIAGALVALREGLPVAQSLPDDIKGEVIAAFLPQLFAKLAQYATEMKLGAVDDLLFTTHGAHCQIYRRGDIYFAVLSKPGEALPFAELRILADALARQTQHA